MAVSAPRRSLVLLIIALIAALVASCSSFSSTAPEPDPVEPGPESRPTTVGSTTSTTSPPSMAYEPLLDAVPCDGAEHEVGLLDGASPGEEIVFSSSVPVRLTKVTADQRGEHPLIWRCDPAESRLEWPITATGSSSGRTVDFTISGTEGDPFEPAEMAVELLTNGRATCDGSRQNVGRITGAEPGESVLFTSPQTPNIQPGRADTSGVLVFGWVCRPEDDGTVWEVTATGGSSNRSIGFVLTASGGGLSELVAQIDENPFVCNGERRVFGSISGLLPNEFVTFDSPGATDLRDGPANGSGVIDLNWQCGPDSAGSTFTLTANATESGRSVNVEFAGADDPDKEPEPQPTVELLENPFSCDGGRRPVANIARMLPGEFVDFTSPQVQSLRDARADPDGRLTANWQCDFNNGAGDLAWTVTATGRQSGRTVTFEFTGIPWPG